MHLMSFIAISAKGHADAIRHAAHTLVLELVSINTSCAAIDLHVHDWPSALSLSHEMICMLQSVKGSSVQVHFLLTGVRWLPP